MSFIVLNAQRCQSKPSGRTDNLRDSASSATRRWCIATASELGHSAYMIGPKTIACQRFKNLHA
jgi:hypothetical protein